MDKILSGKKVCIVVASGFAEEQFSELQRMLNREGAVVTTVAPEQGLVHGWFENAWGHYFPVDKNLGEALGSDFDRIIMIGGGRAVEKLKGNLHTRRILRHFFEAHKPIVALAEAIELLTLCEDLNGLEVSAPVALLQTLKNAGAMPSGQEVTIDEHLLTFAQMDADWLDTILQHLAEEPANMIRQAA
jgi:protease I